MIYLIIFITSLIFFKIASLLLDNYKLAGWFFIIIAISIPSALAGCRDISIGTDTGGYVLEYFRFAKYEGKFLTYKEEASTEIGYAVFNFIITKLFNNLAWVLFFIEFFVMFFITIAVINLKKYRMLHWAFMIYFLLYFANSLNTTRQMMAMAVCLYSFSFLLKGKFYKAILVACFALTFHFTVFIFFAIFPIYFFIKNASRRKFIYFEIIISILCIVVVYILDSLILSFIGVGLLTDKFEMYTSEENAWGSNIPMSDLLLCSVVLILLTFFKKYSFDSVKTNNLFHTVFLVSVILCFSAIKSTFAVRGMYYFSFLSIIIVPIFIQEIGKKKLASFLSVAMIVFFILYWILTIPYANLGETYPYTSKILSL